MQRYLVFDAGCGTCMRLADEFQGIVGNRLMTLNIHSDQARELLDRAFPAGWAHAPYLVVVDTNHVRAWTGIAAACRLGVLLGPTKSWRIWSHARRLGVAVSLTTIQPTTAMTSRRRLIKLGASVVAAAGLLGLRRHIDADPASAQPAPCQSYMCYFYGGQCQTTVPCTFSPSYSRFVNWYQCWDGSYFCGWQVTDAGCC